MQNFQIEEFSTHSSICSVDEDSWDNLTVSSIGTVLKVNFPFISNRRYAYLQHRKLSMMPKFQIEEFHMHSSICSVDEDHAAAILSCSSGVAAVEQKYRSVSCKQSNIDLVNKNAYQKFNPGEIFYKRILQYIVTYIYRSMKQHIQVMHMWI